MKTSFDTFISEFQQTDNPDEKYTLIEQIISSLAIIPYGHKNLTKSEMIAHKVFVILRDYVIINQLRQKHAEDTSSQKVLLNVSLLFMNLCNNINETNITVFKSLFIHKPLIDELANCLHEISTHGKYLNDPSRLRSVSSLLIALQKIRKHNFTALEYSLIAPILFSVTQCLCSSYALDMIKSLERNFIQELDEVQMLFLYAMPLYVKWYWDYCDPEYFVKILRILLNDFTAWFTSCQPESYLQRSSQIDAMIRHLNYFLVRPTEFDSMNIFSEEFYDDYCKLVLHWSSILSSILAWSSCTMNVKLAARTSVQILYNLTLHLNVLNFMKTIPSFILMLLKVTDLDHDEVQLNAYRCLGKIMIEADIKTMTKPSKIAAVYIAFLKDTIDDSKKTERFYSLLESLKSKFLSIVFFYD
ncbi:unnamed protein product [Rotaria sp. Silwood2]|nr:unnamed protein product [Rotaria sp. Silwood2]CAF4166908.1 unnamed protein product [Rotaria sp. Silwood2]